MCRWYLDRFILFPSIDHSIHLSKSEAVSVGAVAEIRGGKMIFKGVVCVVTQSVMLKLGELNREKSCESESARCK